MAKNAFQDFMRQPSTADLYDIPVARGGVFPVTEYLNRSEFDLSSGIPGAIGSAFTAPARAARGQIPESQMIPEAFNFAGSLMSGGYAAPKPSNSIGIFGGRMAKTADQEALARAEQMAQSGAPREQIWNETGWFQGPDQKWRFEIDDSASTYVGEALRPKEYNIQGQSVMGAEGVAGDILRHDPLVQAYPDVKDMLVSEINYSDGRGGHYGRANSFMPEYIGLNTGAPLFQGRPIMLHELQHSIQNREGFSPGAAPTSYPKEGVPNPAYEAYIGATESNPYLREFKSIYNSPEYKAQLDASNELYNNDFGPLWDKIFSQKIPRSDKAARQRQNDQLDAIHEQYDAVVKERFPVLARVDELENILKSEGISAREPQKLLDQMGAYRSTAGEVEARTVEARKDLTAEQRRSRPPWLDYDVPQSAHIVRAAPQDDNQALVDALRSYLDAGKMPKGVY